MTREQFWNEKCPKGCGATLTDNLAESGQKGFHFRCEIDSPRCVRSQLVAVTAERDALKAEAARLRTAFAEAAQGVAWLAFQKVFLNWRAAVEAEKP